MEYEVTQVEEDLWEVTDGAGNPVGGAPTQLEAQLLAEELEAAMADFKEEEK